MDDKPQVETKGGAYVKGNVTIRRGNFAGRDIITNVFGLARWQTYLLALAVALIALTLVVVVFPYLRIWFTPKIPLPDPVHIKPVVSSQGSSITALVTDKAHLWGGARQGEQHFLFQSDFTTAESTTLQRVQLRQQDQVITFDNPINDLYIDCQGNLWILVEARGTLVYNPITAAISPWLNRNTPGSTLSKNTTNAVTSQCDPNGNVNIWLGREGIHTLRYEGMDTSFATLQFVAPADDVVHLKTQALSETNTLLMTDGSLWVGGKWAGGKNAEGELMSLSSSGMTEPQVFALKEEILTLAYSQESNVLWAGGYTKLFEISRNATPRAIALVDQNQQALGIRATTLAVDLKYVWTGDDCSNSGNQDCCPLAVYVPKNDLFACVTKQMTNVSALVVDEQTNLWIGSATGLFVYTN